MKGREALHSVHLSAAASMAIITEYCILLTFKLILLPHRVSCYSHTPKCSLSLLCMFLGCQSSYSVRLHRGHTVLKQALAPYLLQKLLSRAGNVYCKDFRLCEIHINPLKCINNYLLTLPSISKYLKASAKNSGQR